MCNMRFHLVVILVYVLSAHNFSLVSVYKKYLNSSEGKEYVRRKLKCISTLKWPEPHLRLFSESVLQGYNKWFTL